MFSSLPQYIKIEWALYSAENSSVIRVFWRQNAVGSSRHRPDNFLYIGQEKDIGRDNQRTTFFPFLHKSLKSRLNKTILKNFGA